MNLTRIFFDAPEEWEPCRLCAHPLEAQETHCPRCHTRHRDRPEGVFDRLRPLVRSLLVIAAFAALGVPAALGGKAIAALAFAAAAMLLALRGNTPRVSHAPALCAAGGCACGVLAALAFAAATEPTTWTLSSALDERERQLRDLRDKLTDSGRKNWELATENQRLRAELRPVQEERRRRLPGGVELASRALAPFGNVPFSMRVTGDGKTVWDSDGSVCLLSGEGAENQWRTLFAIFEPSPSTLRRDIDGMQALLDAFLPRAQQIDRPRWIVKSMAALQSAPLGADIFQYMDGADVKLGKLGDAYHLTLKPQRAEN